MWKQKASDQSVEKSVEFRIYVVSSIDEKVQFTYKTGVRDFIGVPISEARRETEKNKNCYLATDDEIVAKEYNLKLLEAKYK